MFLAPFLPQDRLRALAQGTPLAEHTLGTALFADLSGFTALTRAFAAELGPQRGAEALLEILNPLFASLIAPVQLHGGSVISFAGDAILGWFAGPSPAPAVACARAMQNAMHPFATAQTPAGTTVDLLFKVALAHGPARRWVVGDPAVQQLDVLAGATLARMAAAEQLAERDELVVSREVAQHLGPALPIAAWRGDFAVVHAPTALVKAAPVEAQSVEAALIEATLRPWVLPEVATLLQTPASLGDLRPITALFVRWAGIDYETDPAAREKLNAFVGWAQNTLRQYGGNLLHLALGATEAHLYAIFGAPTAHEDHATRALRAAIQLHALPPPLAYLHSLQIGLARGEAWAGCYGAPTRRTYSVIGREVNLAARLMGAAPPGQIWVAGDLPQLSGFNFVALGPHHYKGFAAPLPTFAVQGQQLPSERFFSEAMVGREAELQQLLDMAQPLFVGQPAGVTIIYGEPGVGKSRLSAALQAALGPRVAWLTGQTDPILREPFNPFIYWLKRHFGQTPTASPAENRAQFEHHLAQLLPHAVGPELQRTHSFLGALLNLHWPGSLYEELNTPALRHANTLAALRAVLATASAQQPVVFELEDAHWLDEASRAALLTLTRDLAYAPLLWVLTSRYADDGTPPNFALAPGTRTLTLDLNTLAPAAQRQQAETILQGPISSSLHALLQAKTEGNPFFAQQLLYYLREGAALQQSAAGEWQLRPESLLALPQDIQALLLARLDRLTAQVKEVVQTAAVLGREFELTLLQTMLQTDVRATVQQAAQEQIWSALSDLQYIFKHVLLRDAAYAMQLRPRLRALHQLAAEALENLHAADCAPYYGEIAHHYEMAHHYGATPLRDQAGHYLRLAGDRALALSAFAEAAQFYQRAAALFPPETHALCRLAEALRGLSDFAAVQTTLHQALAVARTDVERVAAQASLGEAFSELGQYPQAYTLLTATLPLARASGEANGLARTLYALGDVCWRMGQVAEGEAYMDECLPLTRALGDTRRELFALNRLGTLVAWRDPKAGREIYVQTLALAQQVGNRERALTALVNLGELAKSFNELEQLHTYATQAVQLARETGITHGLALALINLADSYLLRQDYAAARAHLREGLALAVQIQFLPHQVASVLYLGKLIYLEGDHPRGLAIVGLAQHHPAWNNDLQREWVQQILPQWNLTPETAAPLLAAGTTLSFTEVVAEFLQTGEVI